VSSQAFLQKVRELHDRGAHLAGIEALNDPALLRLTYYFVVEGKNERVPLDTQEGSAPSLIHLYGWADFLERSLYRTHQIKFVGNPNLDIGF
jgi:NADH:ubiquinone oxidoreductase subunit C